MRHVLALAKRNHETGTRCRESGPYRCAGPVEVVVFIREGEHFPAGSDGRETTWTLAGEDADDDGST